MGNLSDLYFCKQNIIDDVKFHNICKLLKKTHFMIVLSYISNSVLGKRRRSPIVVNRYGGR